VAIFVFIKVSFYPNPVRLWRYVATAALLLSFVPDVLLAVSHDNGWRLARGLRSHDHARSSMDSLHNAAARACVLCKPF
jgi:hypothetical protein